MCMKHWEITAVAVDILNKFNVSQFAVIFFSRCGCYRSDLSTYVLVYLPNHKFIIQFQNYGHNNKKNTIKIFYFSTTRICLRFNFFSSHKYATVRSHKNWTRVRPFTLNQIDFYRNFIFYSSINTSCLSNKNLNRAQLTHI